MDEAALIQYITDTFPGVDPLAANGDVFFIYDPDRDLPGERKFPFATLVIGDRYDQVSQLDRPGVYRLNCGVNRDTYRALFGAPPARLGPGGVIETEHDFTVLDQLLPHPVYAPQAWISVLNPGEQSWEQVKGLLQEAYSLGVQRHVKLQRSAEKAEASAEG
jgi:hypothetical protein